MSIERLLVGALALAAALHGTGVSPPSRAVEPVRLRFHDDPVDPLFGSLGLEGLSPDVLRRLAAMDLSPSRWAEVLSLRVAAAPAQSPAILASWSATDRAILLRPRFLPRGGLELVAAFDGARLGELLDLPAPLPVLEQRLVMPAAAVGPSTVVEAVYPSSPEVPENLLRLYLYFSAPMRGLDVPRHIHLYDARGDEIELPFVEVDSGLWDPARRRLTLLFHPGRIKRGVGPNLAMGPPLRAGESYTLVVDRELRDARGLPLAAPFRTALVAGSPDRVSPDPHGWTIHPPASPGEVLSVELDEPLDHALLRRLLAVVGETGEPVAGSVEVCCGERSWRFVPRRPWSEGEYVLEVSPTIEDLAGNTPVSLFDLPTSDLRSSEDRSDPAPGALHLPFRIRFSADDR